MDPRMLDEASLKMYAIEADGATAKIIDSHRALAERLADAERQSTAHRQNE